MCNFINWYADANGYVIQCEACEHFQVSFGTTMLTMNYDQFHEMIDTVTRKKEEMPPIYDHDTKCILLPTMSRDVHSILSEREFTHLYNMLHKADNEIRSAELLKLFNVV